MLSLLEKVIYSKSIDWAKVQSLFTALNIFVV